jgi:hypothetical protein
MGAQAQLSSGVLSSQGRESRIRREFQCREDEFTKVLVLALEYRE